MRKELTGKRFGRLKVIEFVETKNNRSFWKCICDCGNETLGRSDALTTGHKASCGCYGKEQRIKANTTHGLTKTPEYRSWTRMRDRCFNKNDNSYHNYGGRGISIHPKWDSFVVFLSDMGKRTSKNHSLERVDNNKGYSPSNCIWATRAEQQNNTRRNHRIEFNGVINTVAEWSRQTGIESSVIIKRLQRGWDIEKTLCKQPA